MSKLYFLLLLFCISSLKISAQRGMQLNEASIVKDTTGNIIPYIVWSKMVPTGRFDLKAEKPGSDENVFIIRRLSDQEYEKKLSAMPKPKESNFFKTGKTFLHFTTSDMDGFKINTKELAGKIIVLNYWFINCPPCRLEMPDLNTLVESYKDDSDVLFIAVALDKRYELKEFLKTHYFGYKIIDDGRFIASQNRINGYPTNVIIDQAGKIYFHSSGYSANTGYWIKKSIEELKKAGETKDKPVSVN